MYNAIMYVAFTILMVITYTIGCFTVPRPNLWFLPFSLTANVFIWWSVFSTRPNGIYKYLRQPIDLGIIFNSIYVWSSCSGDPYWWSTLIGTTISLVGSIHFQNVCEIEHCYDEEYFNTVPRFFKFGRIKF